jgi:hypothetical protein
LKSSSFIVDLLVIRVEREAYRRATMTPIMNATASDGSGASRTKSLKIAFH